MIPAWERRLMGTYGLLEGQYAAILAKQGGVCAICGKKPGRNRLVVDHDHETKRVRGLLHARCNRSLGPFEYSEQSLRALLAYIRAILKDRYGRAT